MEIALDYVEPRLGKIVPALGFPPCRARRAAFRERFRSRAVELFFAVESSMNADIERLARAAGLTGHNLGALFEGERCYLLVPSLRVNVYVMPIAPVGLRRMRELRNCTYVSAIS